MKKNLTFANVNVTLTMLKKNLPNLSAKAPLLPLVICMVAGIVVGSPWPDASVTLLVLALLVVVSLLAGRWPAVQSAGCGLCFVVLGMWLKPAEEPTVADGVQLEAVVASVPVEKPKTMMVELLLPSGVQQRCYVWKDTLSRRLQVGDNLLVRISDGQFVRRADWQWGGTGTRRLSAWQRLRIKALQWRSSLLERLRNNGGDEQALAIMAAMTLGDRSAVSKELRATYNEAGAAHILALSGLHLTIIYLLLTRLTLGRRRSWLVQAVVVLAIWAFALLTGLSTSIVRAAVMLTIYSLFGLGGRRRAPLGVLSFTALLMLLVDSSALYDVGFQLSFLSMLAILLFTPLFDTFVSAKWMMGHPVVKYLYGLVAVSVAAQLGTAPLVAYYFGQLPVWFVLTNLVVVPLATLILCGTLVALLVPAVAGIVVALTTVMNDALGHITALPLASIGGLHPSVLQVAMAYVVIGVLYLLLATSHAASARCR